MQWNNFCFRGIHQLHCESTQFTYESYVAELLGQRRNKDFGKASSSWRTVLRLDMIMDNGMKKTLSNLVTAVLSFSIASDESTVLYYTANSLILYEVMNNLLASRTYKRPHWKTCLPRTKVLLVLWYTLPALKRPRVVFRW